MDYQKQAIDFLTRNNLTLKIKYLKFGRHFADEIHRRNIYKFTLSNGKEKYSGKFGDSLKNNTSLENPTEYDILSCIGKSDVSSFGNFCDNYGYSYDTKEERKTVEKIYKACLKEAEGLADVLTGKQLKELQKIN